MAVPGYKVTARRVRRPGAPVCAVALAALLPAGCAGRDAGPPKEAASEPCLTAPSAHRPDAAGEDVPRFAAGSPFDTDYRPPAFRDGKRLWARSCLYRKAPALVVEEWLGPTPETAGKYVLVAFWATWCPPCRKSIHLLNRLHARFAGLAVGRTDSNAENAENN
ncbi:MAG: TlpA disulfide reductase family protein [Phycisphaerae bacterium]